MNRRLRIALIAVGALLAGSIGILFAVIVHLEILPGAAPPLNREYVAVNLNDRRFDDRSRTMKLSRDGDRSNLYAYAGCNHFGGPVAFRFWNRFSMASGHMTLMACPGLNEIEKEYFDAIQRARRWRIEAGKLILEGDKDVLQFEASAR